MRWLQQGSCRSYKLHAMHPGCQIRVLLLLVILSLTGTGHNCNPNRDPISDRHMIIPAALRDACPWADPFLIPRSVDSTSIWRRSIRDTLFWT